MQIRLQKYLADCGIASRRKAEELIANGEIKLNGVTVTELGTKVEPEADIVLYKGKEIHLESRKVYIMLNKPSGYVTTVKDQFDRPTVMDLLAGVTERVFPVGRLDYDTSGLVLLTNDGDLAYKMTHPKYEVKKVYIARLIGMPTEQEMKRFREGLEIEDYKTGKAEIEIVKNQDKHCVVRITIREGRNRQVRKMCEAIGHNVLSLKRVSIGGLRLGDLPKGKFRELSEKEIRLCFGKV